MGKLSSEDEMHTQMLCKQGFRAKTILASYPGKNWSVSTLQTICVRSLRRVQLWRVMQVVVGRSLVAAAGEHFEHSV